jgi:hypothetical protein
LLFLGFRSPDRFDVRGYISPAAAKLAGNRDASRE